MRTRAELRGELTRRRRRYFPGQGSHPRCCICRGAITTGGEIHEVLITRGMLRDADRAALILVPENSVLLHTACHPACGRGSEADFLRCALDLYAAEGDAVLDWLARIEGELPILAPQARREYLLALQQAGLCESLPLSRQRLQTCVWLEGLMR